MHSGTIHAPTFHTTTINTTPISTLQPSHQRRESYKHFTPHHPTIARVPNCTQSNSRNAVTDRTRCMLMPQKKKEIKKVRTVLHGTTVNRIGALFRSFFHVGSTDFNDLLLLFLFVYGQLKGREIYELSMQPTAAVLLYCSQNSMLYC